ncbi:Anaphase-promoting complex subunit 1 [Microsporum audouinii]
MAAITSLGLHKPSAFGYLVAESILPADAPEDSYTWRCYNSEGENGGIIEEELLYTDKCVVWSRGGIVKRSFNFDVEGESIVEALFTYFPAGKANAGRRTGSANDQTSQTDAQDHTATSLKSKNSGRLNGKIRKRVVIQDQKDSSGVPGLSILENQSSIEPSRALVVVLKSQIHIYFISGDSHVIPLPFELDSIWPTPNGLLFQRKLPEKHGVPVPSAPQNSFISSQSMHPMSGHSASFKRSSGTGNRSLLTISPSQTSKFLLKPEKDDSAPRVFSLLDPHSEMGLVAVSSSSHDDNTHRRTDILNPIEELLYVSPTSEIPLGVSTKGSSPLILLVTLNPKLGMHNIWATRYRPKESLVSSQNQRRKSSSTHSKRRSSHFDITTGTTTPIGPGPSNLRESFGGNGQGWNSSQQFNFESKQEGTADLAAQLGQEFEDVGVTSKASRRVSSLLARSDLMAANDRTTFSDIAGSQLKSSFHGGSRRGESFGGSVLRLSQSFNRRSSLPPGTASVYSNGSSFLDAPVDKLLESLNNGGDFDGFESMGIKETVSNLPREVILSKVGSVPSGVVTTNVLPPHSQKVHQFKVFTLSSSDESTLKDPESTPLAVCILNRNSKDLVVVTLSAQLLGPQARRNAKRGNGFTYKVRALNVRHGSSVLDCCKLVDRDISRMLVLSSTSDGRGELTIQAPWSTLVRVELPCSMILYEPSNISLESTPSNLREGGHRRVLCKTPLIMRSLAHSTANGKVDIIDEQNRKHRVQIQLQPHNSLVRRVLSLCRYVLRHSEKSGDGIHIGWWQALKWLRARDVREENLEWTALVVILFSMAVYFIDDISTDTKAPLRREKRGSLMRSSTGSSINLTDWHSMVDQESGAAGTSAPWMTTTAWDWIREENTKYTTDAPRSDQLVDDHKADNQSSDKNSYITRCSQLARDFLSSPQGEAATGGDGYLPIAISRDQGTRRTALGTILVGLHLLREELKLSITNTDNSRSERGLLLPILSQIGGWLGWGSWAWKEGSYYATETPGIDSWGFEDTRITGLDMPPEPFAPPSIFSFIENSFQRTPCTFLTLMDVVSSSTIKPGGGRIWGQAVNLTPRTLALTGLFSEIGNKQSAPDRVALLLRWGITASMIDTLPDGISTPLHEAIFSCQGDPPLSWGSSLLELVDREDLFLSTSCEIIHLPSSRSQFIQPHDALRDVRHIGNSMLDSSLTNSFELSTEADRHCITKLIFRDDRRFFEAARILNQMKAPTAECLPEPDWSESDLLEAQKDLVQLVTLRTLSIPAGRAMLCFDGRVPLLTEKLPIPAFSLQCVMKPSNVTISADRSAFAEEKACWAFFHNGVSTGLAISKYAKGIDTSWILYNKPNDLTNRHAGFLLALGLNGHLKTLAKWVAFKYLTPKHTMTSIGLLLGLSVSYLGTMDPLITRLLSVHVTRMLPPGAAELNLSPLTQTTGIMGIGLLYCNSQHRRMSEVLLSEIEHMDEEEASISKEPLRYEGYRLAAGFALGFVNLGRGKDLQGLQDMRIVERLLALAVGTKEVDLVHILDKATAGATVAIAIIFMKSNDRALAQKVDIPDTEVQFDYVRPDIFLLRTLARHIIMWDSIKASQKWIRKSLPSFYRRRYILSEIRRLSTDDMPYFNIVAGLCFALGLRFAGSGSIAARDLLVAHLDQFIRICRIPALNYDAKLTQNSVRNCQDIIALSAAAVMAGTGDLVTFRRIRSLHGRVDVDTHYGSHMATHMALGMLFLGGGTYTLGTSNIAVASLLCSLYPVFPTSILNNNYHLQAFRHLWVLAAEPRCLVPRDLDTRRPVTIPVSLTLRTGEVKTVTAPCLLPELDEVSLIKIASADHWSITLDVASNESLRSKFQNGDQSIYLRRRATHNDSERSVFSTTIAALSDAQDIPPPAAIPRNTRPFYAMPPVSLHASLQPSEKGPGQARMPPRHIWDYIFDLPAFSSLDMSERVVVLPQVPFHESLKLLSNGKRRNRISSPSWLRPTSVDTRLVLDRTLRNLVSAAARRGVGEEVTRDRLWQLRLLFAWTDSATNNSSDDSDGHGAKLETDLKKIEQNFQAVPISQYTGRWLFLNSTYWDFGGSGDRPLEEPESLTQLYGAGRRPCHFIPSLQAPPGHPLATFAQTERYLLNYFIEGIGPNCSLSPFYNPYLSLVTPLALSHAPLRNTLLAIAANQFCRLGNVRFEKEAYICKQRALAGLQKEINEQKPSFGAIATVLMLCFHDISDGCTPSWKMHLRGGLQLLNLLPLKSAEGHMLKQFFVMYFVAHDIMGRTTMEDDGTEGLDNAWLVDDNLEEEDRYAYGLLSWADDLDQQDLEPRFGEIKGVHATYKKISKSGPLSISELSYFNNARNKLELALQGVQQTLPSYAKDREDLLRVAEVKRLTALLYLRQRLGTPHNSSTLSLVRVGLLPRYPITHNTSPTHAALGPVPPVMVESPTLAWKEKLVTDIIAIISTLPDTATLLWPLFVVGSVDVDNEEHRRFILEKLQKIQNSRNLGNIRRARLAVESTYRARDLDHPRGNVWGREGRGISLA